ncbi:MAG TPA: hypothetical protein VJL59_12030 [Anaerolineales bacterium]|nr:hypothetical protein [Anaerolineales bacterium]
MNPLHPLIPSLSALAQHASVLPAHGGAMEQLLQPDADERDDERLTGGEGVIDRFAEHPAPVSATAYIPCPPLVRIEHHRYRWFLDGSLRSYFLCTVLEGSRAVPVTLAQIGAARIHRRDDGKVTADAVPTRLLLLLDRSQVSDAINRALDSASQAGGPEVVNTSPDDVFTHDAVESRDRAQGKAKVAMRRLELELAQGTPLQPTEWLVLDGTVYIASLLALSGPLERTIGVSKSFAKSPRFRASRGRGELHLTHLLATLPDAHRTPAFVSAQGKTAFWYVRLRPQGVVDYPLMGIVKVDVPLSSEQDSLPADLITDLSRSLVGERTVTPYGRDVRWHAHLYPLYCAEQAIRGQFYSTMMLKEGLTAYWRKAITSATPV